MLAFSKANHRSLSFESDLLLSYIAWVAPSDAARHLLPASVWERPAKPIRTPIKGAKSRLTLVQYISSTWSSSFPEGWQISSKLSYPILEAHPTVRQQAIRRYDAISSRGLPTRYIERPPNEDVPNQKRKFCEPPITPFLSVPASGRLRLGAGYTRSLLRGLDGLTERTFFFSETLFYNIVVLIMRCNIIKMAKTVCS